jgi:hypothetical protein
MSGSVRPACAAALRDVLAGAETADADALDRRRRAQQHVASCPDCAGLHDDLEPEQILAVLDAKRPRRAPALRVVLGVLAAAQLAMAVPWLLGFNPLGTLGGHALDAHLTRDGAIGIIIGVAGVTTALQPRHGVAMLVMAVAALGMQIFGFAIDENHDRVSAIFEVQHLLGLVVSLLIAVITMRRGKPITDPDRPPRLRIVR